MLLACVEAVVVGIVVVAGLAQHGIGYVVLACAVAFHYRFDEVFRHIGIVCQQLLGVLGQTVAAVAERRVVVMRADAWVKAHTFYYGSCVESLYFGVGVELVEVAYTQGEICIGKEFHRFGVLHAHE